MAIGDRNEDPAPTVTTGTPAPPVRLAVLAILALALACYWNSLSVPFHFDDQHMVLDNDFLRRPEARRGVGVHERGLLLLTLAANYKLGGLAVWHYHAVNLALHALNAVLVFFFARALLRRLRRERESEWAGLLAGSVFAVHPFATEAVTYISSRSALLGATFYLLGALVFLKARYEWRSSVRAAALVLPCFALACAAKQDGATLTLAVLIIERRVPRPAGERRWAWVKYHAPAVACVLLGVAIAGPTVVRFVAERAPQHPVGRYLLTEPWVALLYLRLLVVPVGLNVDPDVPAVVLWSARALAGLGALGTTVWFFWRFGRRAPVVAFALAWFYVGLLPSSSLIPLEDFMAEHRAYLGSVGIVLLLAWVVAVAAARIAARQRLRWLVPALAAAWVVALAAGTVLRNRTWQTGARLWTDAIEKSPRKARPYSNLAIYLLESGDLSAAEESLHKAVSLNPAAPEPRAMLGLVAVRRGDRATAQRQFEATLERDPTHYQAANNLAILYAEQGDYARAEPLVRRVLARKLSYPDTHAAAYRNLAKLAERRGATAEAERHYRAAVAAGGPGAAEASAELAALLGGEAPAAGASPPGGPAGTGGAGARAEFERGNRLLAEGRLPEAAAAWERALALEPALSEAANNLGNYHLQGGDRTRAERYYRRAVESSPANAEACFNLAATLEQLGRAAEARPFYERFVRMAAGAHPERVREVKARLGLP
ncbi:MAG: tetratricopeptide repeat protein [Deltaproteobacteria bacterium]|nr:tetratricopeptide repeat protein [Deltaproteobacteria bacterium]